MAQNASYSLHEPELALPGLLYAIIEKNFSPNSPLFQRMCAWTGEELYFGCLVMAYCQWIKLSGNEHVKNNMQTLAYFESCARPYRKDVLRLLLELKALILN